MNRPTTVTICGQPFTVDVNRLEDDVSGLFLQHAQRIVVLDGQAPDQERDSVLHEVIHAILALTGHADPDEGTISALAVGLLAILRDNRELVAWLTEAAA